VGVGVGVGAAWQDGTLMVPEASPRSDQPHECPGCNHYVAVLVCLDRLAVDEQRQPRMSQEPVASLSVGEAGAAKCVIWTGEVGVGVGVGVRVRVGVGLGSGWA
jgi:hypothetical protein